MFDARAALPARSCRRREQALSTTTEWHRNRPKPEWKNFFGFLRGIAWWMTRCAWNRANHPVSDSHSHPVMLPRRRSARAEKHAEAFMSEDRDDDSVARTRTAVASRAWRASDSLPHARAPMIEPSNLQRLPTRAGVSRW